MPTREATVRLDPRRTVGPIDRRIFGGFLEHLGRAVYGGVYDPDSSHARRARVPYRRGGRAAADCACRSCGTRVGTSSATTTGETASAPGTSGRRRADFAWRSIETNAFGTDEFIEWCRLVGTAPMLAVNLGTGHAEAGCGARRVLQPHDRRRSRAALRSSRRPARRQALVPRQRDGRPVAGRPRPGRHLRRAGADARRS